jgi:predicted short-subunit dehydrogenase-like oxidoreductase (DUF2520 family)
MFDSITVIGASGRAGSAISGRLRERGLAVVEEGAALVLLCVPDRAIAEVAAGIEAGPWIAHVSGATPLAALDPHRRRFSVHPLQTLVRSRGPEQLDGAFGAVTAESADARERGLWLARTLGLEPFELADDARPLYHSAPAFACNYLVTLYRIAASLFDEVGAPPAALVPLMQRTVENGFEATGPIVRGDWSTIDAHLTALRERRPELVRVYEALREATPA